MSGATIARSSKREDDEDDEQHEGITTFSVVHR